MTLVEAIAFVLENADLQDDGPHPWGWMSKEMLEAENVLELFVEDAKKERSRS